jgi:hypothetical protein
MQYSGVRLLPLARTHRVLFQSALPASQPEKNSAILQMYIIVAPDILWTPILAAPLSQMYIVCFVAFGYLCTANETIPKAGRRRRLTLLLYSSKINCVIITPALRATPRSLLKKRRFNSRAYGSLSSDYF